MVKQYRVRRATEKDANFLAQAMQDSERAHTGKGIWDVAIGDDADPTRSLVTVLKHACLNDEQGHCHYSHFLVVVASNDEDETEELVATGCCYAYPKFSVSKSYPGLSLATRTIRGEVSEEESISMWKKIDCFLEDCFPDNIEYNNTWMLESIFVSPAHRGKGIVQLLLSALVDEGRKDGTTRECLTCCGIGNTAAHHSYLRAGFECVGEGRSELAQQAMGYPGFHLFRKSF